MVEEVIVTEKCVIQREKRQLDYRKSLPFVITAVNYSQPGINFKIRHITIILDDAKSKQVFARHRTP